MQAFLHATTAGEPLWICEDVRRLIYEASLRTDCQRCGRVVSTGRRRDRVHMCFLQDRLVCFTCWHRLRCPL